MNLKPNKTFSGFVVRNDAIVMVCPLKRPKYVLPMAYWLITEAYIKQRLKWIKDPVCGDIHYSEIPVDYKANFRCDNDKWTCDGELVCAEGKWYCISDGSIYDALCRKLLEGSETEVDRNAPIVSCESLDGNFLKYGSEIKKMGYISLKETTCNGYFGGYCRYGYNINKEAETCPTWDFSKFGGRLSNGIYEDEWLEKPHKGVCAEGNCKCGEGACPQYAVCDDGQCICGTSRIGTNYGEFYCQIEVGHADTEWSVFFEHVLECREPKGCHTPDG